MSASSEVMAVVVHVRIRVPAAGGCELERDCGVVGGDLVVRVKVAAHMRCGAEFYQPEIRTASTVRFRVSGNDITTVRGLLDRVCIIVVNFAKGLVPLLISV